MKTRSWIVAIFMVTITAFSAHAATGTVAGRLTFFQSNGGYCPDDGLRDCSGSLYPQSQRSSWSPVANGRVYLYQLSTGLLIGAGTTNSNGNFAINWFGPTTAQAVVAFKAEHKDGRFKVIAPSGALYRFNSPIFNLTPGTTPGSPQTILEVRFGTSSSPEPLVNYYDAAEQTWSHALQGSNALLARWSNVELRGIYSGQGTHDPDECEKTCGGGLENYMKLDPTQEFNLSTVAHELGHIASYLMNPFVQNGDYSYPNTCVYDPEARETCGDHSASTAEWQHVQFEEGFASFVGTVALYAQAANSPYFCVTHGRFACTDGTDRMELSTGKLCSVAASRNEKEVTRYLWDIRDSRDDGFPYSDTLVVSYWDIYDGLAAFPVGTSDYETDEQLNAAETAYDNRDGRNSYDYYWNSWDLLGWTGSQWLYNCGADSP